MDVIELREKFWEKIKKEDRGFSWFKRKYLSECKLAHNTLYKQAKGEELTKMSDFLIEAIEKYLDE